jgi:glycosyltransferase involved in cell wall biosynthesis
MNNETIEFIINLPRRGFRFTARQIYSVLKKIFQYRDPYNTIQLYKPDLDVKIIEKDYEISKNFPKYSMLMPVLNEAFTIDKVLQSIEQQTYLPDEVVIVDGGSNDKTIENIEQYQKNSSLNIVVVLSPVKNLGYQRNLSVETAKNNLVLNIDAGIELDKNFATNMLGPFLEYEDIDLVGGIHHATIKYGYSKYFSPPTKAEHFKCSIKPYGTVVAYKRDLALKAGRYPEYLSYAGEDTLFFYYYQKISKKWIFNKNAFILWNHPNNLEAANRKLYHYMLGNFEIGLWPYFYYDYLFFSFLHIANLNLPIFKANYSNFLLRQSYVEVEKRKIKGICCIISKNRIDDDISEKIRNYTFKMIENNYKVFFVNCNKKSDTILKKVKSYLDTDITLLELIPYKYFSIENLSKRYGAFLNDAIFVIDIDDQDVIATIKEAKNNNLKNIKIMYDV